MGSAERLLKLAPGNPCYMHSTNPLPCTLPAYATTHLALQLSGAGLSVCQPLLPILQLAAGQLQAGARLAQLL